MPPRGAAPSGHGGVADFRWNLR
eukprot:SAG11_NODE_29905_length_306_cov_0.570048_1_plen_22_part_10